MKYGLFSIKYLATNFYYYFIKTVDPILMDFSSGLKYPYLLKAPFIRVGYPGVSFFVTSPIFLYIFKNNFKQKFIRLLLLPIVTITLIYLSFYWPGWVQIGPRYLLDVLPFIFIILLYSFEGRKLNPTQKIIIYISSLFNFYLFLSLTLLFPTPI